MTTSADRRGGARLSPERTPWNQAALLRPGQDVEVINLSARGALLESLEPMAPGARAELQLIGRGRRLVRGRIARCSVAHLNPVRYRGAIVFDEPLGWPGTACGCSALS